MRYSDKTLLQAGQILLLCLTVLIGSLLVPATSAVNAAEASRDNILFILDASGSMWGRVENQEKILIARAVMTDLIQGLPQGVNVGLEAYGHQRKGDCNDIEIMVPVGKGDRDALIQQIQSIQLKGKTPIAQSLKLAGEALESVEEETTIVLVSDGNETCEGDPCALTRTLIDKGVNVRVHVVGFDVSGEEKQQLVCIAEAGKGKYFSVQNASQLKAALTEVKQKVIEKVEAPPPPPEEEPEPINVAAASNGGRVVEFTSEYNDSTWAVNNLIDGGTKGGWAGKTNAPHGIVIGFKEDQIAEITDIIINPYTSEDPSRWAKEVEFYISSTYPWKNYTSIGKMTLKNEGIDQIFTPDNPVRTRYVKMLLKSNYGGGSNMEAGEIQIMGSLLGEGEPVPILKNWASKERGGSIEKFTSQYDDSTWAAVNLVDGVNSVGLSWSGQSNASQEIVVKLSEKKAISDIAVNAFAPEDSTNWANHVEIFTSSQYSFKDFESKGIMEIPPDGDWYVLTLAEPVSVKYLKLIFRSNGGGSYMEAGEVRAYGK